MLVLTLVHLWSISANTPVKMCDSDIVIGHQTYLKAETYRVVSLMLSALMTNYTVPI